MGAVALSLMAVGLAVSRSGAASPATPGLCRAKHSASPTRRMAIVTVVGDTMAEDANLVLNVYLLVLTLANVTYVSVCR